MTSSAFNFESKNAIAAESLEIQGMFGQVMGERDPSMEAGIGLNVTSKIDNTFGLGS